MTQATITNPGGCLMQARWDFADTAASGKWSVYHQVYRHLVPPTPPPADAELDEFITGSALVVTKNKVRGRGRALKLRFKAEPGKDMVLVGWALTNSGNTAE